jgi:hypothetical protein
MSLAVSAQHSAYGMPQAFPLDHWSKVMKVLWDTVLMGSTVVLGQHTGCWKDCSSARDASLLFCVWKVILFGSLFSATVRSPVPVQVLRPVVPRKWETTCASGEGV